MTPAFITYLKRKYAKAERIIKQYAHALQNKTED
jgi:hypothetical protein